MQLYVVTVQDLTSETYDVIIIGQSREERWVYNGLTVITPPFSNTPLTKMEDVGRSAQPIGNTCVPMYPDLGVNDFLLLYLHDVVRDVIVVLHDDSADVFLPLALSRVLRELELVKWVSMLACCLRRRLMMWEAFPMNGRAMRKGADSGLGAACLGPDTFSSLRSAQTQANNKLHTKTKANHIDKFQHLLTEKPQTNTPSQLKIKQHHCKTVINLSKKQLTTVLKYIPTRPLRNHDDFISNIEKGLQQLAPGGKVDYLRHQICDILGKTKSQTPNFTRAETKAIKQLRDDNTIKIVPADKGKATVIMDTDHFHELVNNILQDPTTYSKIKKDPTTKLLRQHKTLLKQLKDNFEISQALHNQLSINHPQPPYARATIKIHKNPPKARLLVCSRDTVFYKTAQHLTTILAPLGKTADSFISDFTDFCSKLKNITNPDQIISYDVVDLFTNVPIDDTLQILRRRITETPPETSLTTESIIALTTACISTAYFTWGDEYYQQIHGLPMGSPLSPILTEIYMTHFEQQALTTSPIQPICWYRKVDDTFVILKQDQDPTLLLQHLNQQHPRVQFTIETEKDNQLPFLDVLVCRNAANRIQTSVYRKPTHTDQYIHFNSNHPLRTKTGIISTLTKRAINLSSADPKPEIAHLRQVFTHLNNYLAKLVDKVIASVLYPTPRHAAPKPESAPFRIALPFIGKASHIISRLLKQQANIDTHFTSSNSLNTLLRANGRNTSKPQEVKVVVYKVDCNCGQSYAGEGERHYTSPPIQGGLFCYPLLF
ncbi:uncharacterized protein LOC124120314 [Haliotis rufescens]|uniref:uncharacterized protein LOC124120314 n=1 Tax=Haliotis rufescens TaxID=6454 RepID=UPI00201EA5FB|nr:uncharacterized protein LOC124120314 [Haliotis rufescens]